MTTATKTHEATDRVQIDFLFLDLDRCTRCRDTDASLEAALAAVRDELAVGGIDVEVNKIHVESADQARALRFVSSPTLRVNGRDIALELRESSCGSDACTDGCGESIACRALVEVEAPAEAQCCSATEQQSCCAAEDKAECCGAATGGSCGCR